MTDFDPIDWNRRTNLEFDDQTYPEVFDLNVSTYKEFAIDPIAKSKIIFNLLDSQKDQEIGALLY